MNKKNSGQFSKGLVYGVGVDDTDYQKESRVYSNGVSKIVWYCLTYSVWRNMLRRCYTTSHNCYHKVSVCEEWLIFSNFKKWYENNYHEGYQLDKDLLGGKLYSPDTCVFIPSKLNKNLVGIREYHTGTWFDKKRGNWQSYTTVDKTRIHHGSFATQEEAKRKHLNEKIKLLRNSYIGLGTQSASALDSLIYDIENNLLFDNDFIY